MQKLVISHSLSSNYDYAHRPYERAMLRERNEPECIMPLQIHIGIKLSGPLCSRITEKFLLHNALIQCNIMRSCGLCLLLVKSELQGRLETWWSCYNKGDVRTVANLFTEDSILIPNGSQPINGREGEERKRIEESKCLNQEPHCSWRAKPKKKDNSHGDIMKIYKKV